MNGFVEGVNYGIFFFFVIKNVLKVITHTGWEDRHGISWDDDYKHTHHNETLHHFLFKKNSRISRIIFLFQVSIHLNVIQVKRSNVVRKIPSPPKKNQIWIFSIARI